MAKNNKKLLEEKLFEEATQKTILKKITNIELTYCKL